MSTSLLFIPSPLLPSNFCSLLLIPSPLLPCLNSVHSYSFLLLYCRFSLLFTPSHSFSSTAVSLLFTPSHSFSLTCLVPTFSSAYPSFSQQDRVLSVVRLPRSKRRLPIFDPASRRHTREYPAPCCGSCCQRGWWRRHDWCGWQVVA